MKKYLLMASFLLAGIVPMMADIEDDIYYDPRKVAHKSNQVKSTTSSSRQSNYIANYQDMNVDAYNMRGQYYASPVDTIGAGVSNAEDFVYTTQIQKFYNPTVVVDNEQVLADILENSYGNVTIEYNFAGLPTFGRWYSGFYDNLFYPYYGYYSGPYWAWNFGPLSIGWNWGWGWNNPWNWGWGPSWSWGWGYNPGYWGPSWGPGYWSPGYWGPSRPNYWADYRPGGNRPVGPRPGWSNACHRPMGNMAGNAGRPGNSSRPTPGGIGSSMNQANHNYGRQPGQGAYQGNGSNSNRYQSNGNSTGSTSRPGGYTIGGDGHRRYGNTGASTQSGTSQGSYRTQGSTGSSTGTTGSYRQNGNSTSGGRQSGTGAYQSVRQNSNSGSSTRNSGTTYRSNNSSNGNSNSSNRSYNSGNSSRSYNSGSHSTGGYSTGGHRSSGGGYRGGGGGASRGGRR